MVTAAASARRVLAVSLTTNYPLWPGEEDAVAVVR